MPDSLTREQVRDLETRVIRDLDLPGRVLMESAGRGAAEFLVRQGLHGLTVICAGKGNNGGDGFVVARWLESLGHQTRVLLFCDPADLTGDAAANYRVLERAGLSLRTFGVPPDAAEIVAELNGADVIVDALLGTGTHGSLRAPYPAVIDAINAAKKRILAIDLPSGLDCNTGQPLEACVVATWTVTFIARKAGFDVPGADRFTGAVHVDSLGIPVSWQ